MAATSPIAKVLVSLHEEWDLAVYLERYMSTRRIKREHALLALQEWLLRYPGQTPWRKADLDYFLDANFGRTQARWRQE